MTGAFGLVRIFYHWRTQASLWRIWSGVSRGLVVGTMSFLPWDANQVFSWRRVMVVMGLSGMVADLLFIVLDSLEKMAKDPHTFWE